MDYEKKYKEAIERAKIWQEHLYDVNDKDYADELNYIFPELAESEDERMKKAIIATIHLYYGEPLEDEAKEMIAWLEKQGEEMSDIRYSILDKLIEADDIYQASVNDAMVEEARHRAVEALSKLEISKLLRLEKQGEQKPNPVLDIEIPFGAKDSELQEASYYIPEGFHAEINGNRVVIKRGEQNPAEWSEEDEQYLKDTLRLLEGYSPEVYNYYKVRDWLKSLKGRVLPL